MCHAKQPHACLHTLYSPPPQCGQLLLNHTGTDARSPCPIHYLQLQTPSAPWAALSHPALPPEAAVGSRSWSGVGERHSGSSSKRAKRGAAPRPGATVQLVRDCICPTGCQWDSPAINEERWPVQPIKLFIFPLHPKFVSDVKRLQIKLRTVL